MIQAILFLGAIGSIVWLLVWLHGHWQYATDPLKAKGLKVTSVTLREDGHHVVRLSDRNEYILRDKTWMRVPEGGNADMHLSRSLNEIVRVAQLKTGNEEDMDPLA